MPINYPYFIYHKEEKKKRIHALGKTGNGTVFQKENLTSIPLNEKLYKDTN